VTRRERDKAALQFRGRAPQHRLPFAAAATAVAAAHPLSVASAPAEPHRLAAAIAAAAAAAVDGPSSDSSSGDSDQDAGSDGPARTPLDLFQALLRTRDTRRPAPARLRTTVYYDARNAAVALYSHDNLSTSPAAAAVLA
jgi:hypothetical protein